jgi:hypothetical protein
MDLGRMRVSPPTGQQSEAHPDDPLGIAGIFLEELKLLFRVSPIVLPLPFPTVDARLNPDHHDLRSARDKITNDLRLVKREAGGRHPVQGLAFNENRGDTLMLAHLGMSEFLHDVAFSLIAG